MPTALEELLQKNQNLKGLTVQPDNSMQMQFYDNVDAPTAAPTEAPVVGQPTTALGQVASAGLRQVASAGLKLGSPQMLNMLSTIAQAIDPEGTWSHALGGAVKQRTTNQLFNQLMQSVLQNQGGASPFQQAPQR